MGRSSTGHSLLARTIVVEEGAQFTMCLKLLARADRPCARDIGVDARVR